MCRGVGLRNPWNTEMLPFELLCLQNWVFDETFSQAVYFRNREEVIIEARREDKRQTEARKVSFLRHGGS